MNVQLTFTGFLGSAHLNVTEPLSELAMIVLRGCKQLLLLRNLLNNALSFVAFLSKITGSTEEYIKVGLSGSELREPIRQTTGTYHILSTSLHIQDFRRKLILLLF